MQIILSFFGSTHNIRETCLKEDGIMRKKTFMTLLGLILVVPFSSCNIAHTDSGEASKTTVSPSESGSSSYEEDYSYFYENTSKSYRRFSDRQLGPDSSSSSPLLNVSEPDGTNDKLAFTLNSDQMSYGVFAKYYAGDYGAVVIPPTYQGKPVTVIREGAFRNRSTLTRVYIPHSIIEIGEGAFFSCTDLVTIEVSAYNPNYASFDYCLYNKNLTELIAFPRARKALSFPGNLTTIKKEAFSECDVSRINNWPDSITTIEDKAFKSATTGNSFTLPKNVTTIGEEAFYGCPFSQITFGNRIQDIEASAFESTALASLVIPSSARTIGEQAFAFCNSLENVKIRSGLEVIERRAFAWDRHLTDINLPDTLRELASDAFDQCDSTRKFVVAPQNPYFVSQNYVVYNKAFTRVIKCPATKTSVTLPNTVTEIGDFAFDSCLNLTSINIPNGVTSIGRYAFCACSALSSIALGTGILSIREHAFDGCFSLTDFGINSRLLRIEAYAFRTCGFSTIDLPKTVSFIGDHAFERSFLHSIYLLGDTTSIGESAFEECSFLTTLQLGSGISVIGTRAFYRCNHLATIEYEGTVAEWANVTKGTSAFRGILATFVACCNGNAGL